MARKIIGLALATLIGAGSLWALDEKKVEPAITAKVVMKKVNAKGGFAVIANNEMKSEKPDWDKIAAAAKEIAPLVEAMAKTTPPEGRGKAENWTVMSKAYAIAAKDFEKAVGAKDMDAAKKAFVGLTQCAACHREFSNYSPSRLPDK